MCARRSSSPARRYNDRFKVRGSIEIFFQTVVGARIDIPSDYLILVTATRLNGNNQSSTLTRIM